MCLFACGRSQLPPAAVSGSPPAPVVVRAKPAEPPKAPPSRLAALLEAQQIETIVAGAPEGACAEHATWIVSARRDGSSASCAIAKDEMYCVATAAEAALCPRPATVIAPAWADAIARFLREQAPAQWQITKVAAPSGIEAVRAELVTADSIGSYALVRTDQRWRASVEPIAGEMPTTFVRVIDTSRVTGGASVGLITEMRDGGSEMGEAVDTLDVLCEDTGALRACGQIQLGYLAWQLAAEQRRKHPKGAQTLLARPHVEVLLEPRVQFPDRLVLSVVRSTLSTDAEKWGADTLGTLHAVLADAGEWRFVAGKLVRVR
jgi:hypothetical protein